MAATRLSNRILNAHGRYRLKTQGPFKETYEVYFGAWTAKIQCKNRGQLTGTEDIASFDSLSKDVVNMLTVIDQANDTFHFQTT